MVSIPSVRLSAAVRLPFKGGSTATPAIHVSYSPLHWDRRSQSPQSSLTSCWLRTTVICHCPCSLYSTYRRPSTQSIMTFCWRDFASRTVSEALYCIGSGLTWLTGRIECVRRGASRSTTRSVHFGVPQGSILSPIHTTDADATKLLSCVASASAVCTWIRN